MPPGSVRRLAQSQWPPPPRQRQTCPSGQTEFVICDHTIEVLFADAKEELGIDHYQLMEPTAILRFWTLTLLLYYFLERERHRWRQPDQPLLTIGETRRTLQRLHQQHFLDWLFEQFRTGAQAAELFRQLTTFRS